ncbi:MAG: response regulator transcription factor [Sphingobacteriales bacterium]|nr:MAG: response regulator transcription factor [Sphingobacteriales bacterium]
MNNKFTCVIIDDEPKAIELLKDSLESLYSNIEILHTHTYWKDAIATLKSVDFHLLFIDVSMPQKTGMDLLDLVPGLKCEIIFVTAYSEHALDAFEYGATGYLLKPISDKALSKTVDKALERINYKKTANTASATTSTVSKLAIPNLNGLDYVNIEDIIYLESSSRYTKIVLKNKEILSSYNIGKFKQLLAPYSFYPIHRSYIVNTNFITAYKTAGAVIMSNGEELPVAKNEKDELQALFLKINKHP